MQAIETPSVASTAVPPPPRPGRQRTRVQNFAAFIAALLWFLCARAIAQSAAAGIAGRYDLGDEQPLLAAIFWLFLLVCGLAMLRIVERRVTPLRILLGLPARSTAREEWTLGAAIGWGIALVPVLALALLRDLNVQLWTVPRAWQLFALSIATLAVAALAQVLGVFGYALQRLVEASGPVRATLIVMLLAGVRAALVQTPYGTADGARVLVALLFALLLCICWFRTHGLWLGWGVQFAWMAATGVLFGLPLAGDLSFSSVVDTRVAGPLWLSGGGFGPEAAALTSLLLLAAIPVLIRASSDYAWQYTHAPLVPAGYDVTVPPPAAHVAMEQAQPVHPASLVQIAPAAPMAPPTGRITGTPPL